MQRHGDDDVRAIESPLAAFADQRAERLRQRPAAVVLERMDNRSQDILMRTDGLRSIDDAGDLERRRRQRVDCTPAAIADGTERGMFEQFAAGRAQRAERDGENGVYSIP